MSSPVRGILIRAMFEPQFFEILVRNPKEALREYQLTPGEADAIGVSGTDLVRYLQPGTDALSSAHGELLFASEEADLIAPKPSQPPRQPSLDASRASWPSTPQPPQTPEPPRTTETPSSPRQPSDDCCGAVNVEVDRQTTRQVDSAGNTTVITTITSSRIPPAIARYVRLIEAIRRSTGAARAELLKALLGELAKDDGRDR